MNSLLKKNVISSKEITMAKKVQVTSVTPAIKVKATSKAQQASTRKMVGAIAAATPVGKVAKAVGTAAKAASKVNSATRANARGLKAAKKPTNQTGSKADRADRQAFQGQKNTIKNADPARANRTRGGSLYAMKEYGGLGVATAKLTPKQAAYREQITKELNPIRKKKGKK
jgi:hypothetical protein